MVSGTRNVLARAVPKWIIIPQKSCGGPPLLAGAPKRRPTFWLSPLRHEHGLKNPGRWVADAIKPWLSAYIIDPRCASLTNTAALAPVPRNDPHNRQWLRQQTHKYNCGERSRAWESHRPLLKGWGEALVRAGASRIVPRGHRELFMLQQCGNRLVVDRLFVDARGKMSPPT